jgi:DNA-binding beta-propeller fold protein YncE
MRSASFAMKMRIRFLSRHFTLLFALLSALSASGQDVGALHLEKEIPLPGVEGRIDHFSADAAGQRLFIAALGNGSIEVVDIRRGERTGEIKGLKEPQGVYYDSRTDRLYVATGGDGKLRIYDGKTLTLQQTLDFGGDADNVRFDRQTGEIWVGYGNGGIGIVNSAGQRVGSVELGTHPESFQFEESGDRAFANVPKQFGVSVIDRQKHATVAKWGLGGALANYPMALDDAGRRLFVGCRLPSRLVVLDTNSGRIIGSFPTVGDTDDIFYDAARRLIYVIGGEGAVEVVRQRDSDHYESVGRTPSAPGARTGFFVPNSSRLYVAVPHRGSQTAKVLVYTVDGR